MDQRLILAVAGSGKTRYLIDRLDLEKRFLIVTYTNNNCKNLKDRICRKFGYLPQNISVRTYFSFLMNFCYKPFFHHILREKGVTWENPPFQTRYNNTSLAHYITGSSYLYHNRIAKLCQNECVSIKSRISRYYDCFFIDEVQDLGGYDFDFVKSIIPQDRDVLFVGDFYQHTFETSHDGNKNTGLYKNSIKNYKKKWTGTSLTVDETSLKNSYRCPKVVCDFVTNNLGISIDSTSSKVGCIIYLSTDEEIEAVVKNNSIPKLFYQNSSQYDCFSMNWGASKGLDDFEDVCVVLNGTTQKAFGKDQLKNLAGPTKNKLYVACTRAKRNLYFVDEKKLSFCLDGWPKH